MSGQSGLNYQFLTSSRETDYQLSNEIWLHIPDVEEEN